MIGRSEYWVFSGDKINLRLDTDTHIIWHVRGRGVGKLLTRFLKLSVEITPESIPVIIHILEGSARVDIVDAS